MFLVVAMCHRSTDSQAGSVSHHQACCVSRHHVKTAEFSIQDLDGSESLGGSDSSVILEQIQSGMEECFFCHFFIIPGGNCNSCRKMLR